MRSIKTLLLTALLLCCAVLPASAEPPLVRVMTQNMYLGADLQPLLTAQSQAEFFAKVSSTYQTILASNPAERAAAIAEEISRKRPDLVGLQEAALLKTGPAFDPAPATTVQADLLQLLLSELERRGEHYDVAALFTGFDAEAPSTLGLDVRLTFRDVILVRQTTHGHPELSVSNPQVHPYATNLVVPTPVGPITDPRGWVSVDVTAGGTTFRFINTHLDTNLLIQLAQVWELLAASKTALPTVLVGDFNTTANNPQDPSYSTYQALISASFADAWVQRRPANPGFTCCQAPDLRNPVSLLDQRIDLILLRGQLALADVHVVGDKPNDRTPSGLWPSDHAGVFATVRLPKTKAREARNEPARQEH
jgi:endonuclease/exonuclease/phosphatase family metal-dependent hydrolase